MVIFGNKVVYVDFLMDGKFCINISFFLPLFRTLRGELGAEHIPKYLD